MSDPSEPYSDLQWAFILSQRLQAQPRAAGSVSEPPYTRFSADLLQTAPAAPPAAPPAPPQAEEATSFSSWEEFLGWALGWSRAVAGFVMDPEGFAIAVAGALDAEKAQALGVHLMVALSEADQPEHPGARARAITVEYQQFTVTGMRVTRADGAVFTLAFAADECLDPSVRERICAQAAFNLQHL